MFTLILLFVLLGVLFITSLVLGIYGAVKRKRGYLIASLSFFIVFAAVGIYTGYLFFSASYRFVQSASEKRTGIEVYTAMFGNPEQDCVNVIDYLDPTIPVIDNKLSLYFKSCPQEMKRILTKHEFVRRQVVAAQSQADGVYEEEDRFDITNLGDSVYLYQFTSKDYRSNQVLYISIDSSKAIFHSYE